MEPPAPGPEGVAFAGTDRFAVLDRLGVGSMCVVYRVRDRQHGDIVALKTLRHLDPGSLYRLKQEFRALSHLDHPNLVSFYELVHEREDWFVTMELVEGVDFLTWCRGIEDGQRSRERAQSSQDLRFARSVPAGRAARRDNQVTDSYRPEPDGRLPDLLRLRSSLRQLAEGLQALHDVGRVHRDLKPSNVLVTEAGRVVILDFGLVAEVDQDYTEGTLHQNIAGSAAYMSPEQSVGKPLGYASDWYSVGVMLYEALTGVWPYSGALYSILTAKQAHDPPPPRTLVPGIPEDLDELCMALLRREPAARPTGHEIVERLRTQRPVVSLGRPPVQARFRFRDEQLDALHRALQAVGWNRPVVALVRGGTGAGKTALLREAVKRFKRKMPLTTLKGRCYQWEEVPFEALDGVMDNLSRVLRRLAVGPLRELEGPDLDHLAGLFPVLARVKAIDVHPVEAPQETLLPRATHALRHLLRVLGNAGPIVLAIDDVHWGDTESAALLSDILEAEPELPLLLVVTYAPERAGPFVRALLPRVQRLGVDVRTVDLEPLTIDQAQAIVGELLGPDGSADAVREIALQSGGLPGQLMHLVRSGRSSRPVLEVNEVVVARVKGLPDGPARLLNLLAVAGGPVPTGVAMSAIALDRDAFAAITTLRALELVEVDSEATEGTLAIAGDALREHVLDGLADDDRRALHHALARALESDGSARPETLVEHYAAAGMHVHAGMVAWQAAEMTARTHAWSETVWLLERALEFGQWSQRERQALLGQLGEALARVGHGREAARRFLQAAEEAPRLRVGALRLRAAEQLVTGGLLDEGLPLLASMLREAGLPALPRRICLGPLTRWRRWRLGWRARPPEPRPLDQLDRDRLLKVDVAWTAAEALSLFDPALAACLQPVHLQEALDLGEPERVQRALASEVAWKGMVEPGPTWRETWSEARLLAEEQNRRVGEARAAGSAALAAFRGGLWAEALRLCDEAGPLLLSEPVGAWERHRLTLVAARSHWYTGDLRRSADLALSGFAELQARGDLLFTALVAGDALPWVRMVEDDPDTAVAELEAAMEPWSRQSFTLPHAWALLARARLDLYRGRPSYAWERLAEEWRALTRSGTLMEPVLRQEAWLLRGAVAVAVPGGELLSEAVAAIRQVRGEGVAWAQPWAALLEAAVARSRGKDPSGALEEAARGFQGGGMLLGAILANRATQDDDGVASRWLRERGVRDPERFFDALAPGLR